MNLISTIDEIQMHVAVIGSADFNSLKPYLRLAERNYLEPVLGLGFLSSLETIYLGANSDVATIEDPKQQKVISLVQEVLSNMAVMHALPILSVNIGANGIQVVSNEQMAPASQWRTNQVYDSLAEVGYKTIDSLLTYLESEKATFTLWSEDPVYSNYQAYFIRTAAEFNGLYNINDSRYLFHVIRYCMQRVEQFDIKKSISALLFDELKTKDKSGEIAGNFELLLNDYLKPAISLLTIAKALQERLISLSGGNLTLKFSGSTDNLNESKSPALAELNQTIEALRADARKWITDAQEFITAFPEDFAAFESEINKRKRFNVNNDPSKGTYMF